MSDIAELEARIAALEAKVAATSAKENPRTDHGELDLWLLDELAARYDQPVVIYAGAAQVAAGPVRWQYGLTADEVVGAEFDDAAPVLEAVAHPVRLKLLQAIMGGTTGSAELTELDGIGTSGQVYHHLGQLSAAGWIRSVRRGQWEVPPARVIPLLALVLVARSV